MCVSILRCILMDTELPLLEGLICLRREETGLIKTLGIFIVIVFFAVRNCQTDSLLFAFTMMLTHRRLSMKDNNGHVNLSNIVSVEVQVQQEDFLHIFPNPAKSAVNVVLSSADKIDQHQISIFSTSGQRFFYQTRSSDSNYLEETVDIGNLPQGMYTILVKADDNSFVKKLVKVNK